MQVLVNNGDFFKMKYYIVVEVVVEYFKFGNLYCFVVIMKLYVCS